MSKLIETYQSMLRYAGLTADEKGYVSDFIDGDPVHIDGNRLVLPTNFQLRECQDRERLIFHPLAENIIRGEPVVVKKLRNNINVRLNQVVAVLGQYLLQLAASPALHRRLNPQQLQLLTAIKDVDEKSDTNFASAAIAAMKEGPDRAFMNIYLCRGGVLQGKKYARLGTVSFPCYKKIHEGEFGKLRVKDKDTVLQLLDFIFPGSEMPDSYNVGSDSPVAPFLDALMRTTAAMAERLNELVELYEEFIPFGEGLQKEHLTFNMDWSDVVLNMEDHAVIIRSVPPQNDGPVASSGSAETVSSTGTVAPSPSSAAAAPGPAPLPKTKDGIDFSAAMAAKAPQTPPGAAVMVPMVMGPNGVMMPVSMVPQGTMMGGLPPGWGQQQQQPPVPTWAQVPPEQQMVDTPRGPMTLAVAMQLGLQYRPMPQQMQQQQPHPINPSYGPNAFNMNPVPNWARG